MAIQTHESPNVGDISTQVAGGWQRTVIPPPPSHQFDMSFRGRTMDGLRNISVLAGLWVLYGLVRSAAGDEFAAAVANSRTVLEAQSAVGLPHEAQLQNIFLSYTPLVRAANLYYMYAHFPVTGIFVAWAWLRHRNDFPIIRNTLILVTAIGLGLHLLFPLAPPRKLPSFIDTGIVFGPSPYDLSAAEAANQLAAMPSLHVGWALIVALSAIAVTKHRLRFLALLHPAATAFVVVLTANHYWTDAIVAVLLVIASWILVWRREQRLAESAARDLRLQATWPLFAFPDEETELEFQRNADALARASAACEDEHQRVR